MKLFVCAYLGLMACACLVVVQADLMDFLTSEVTIVEASQRQKTGSLQKTGSSNKGKKDDDKGYHSHYQGGLGKQVAHTIVDGVVDRVGDHLEQKFDDPLMHAAIVGGGKKLKNHLHDKINEFGEKERVVEVVEDDEDDEDDEEEEEMRRERYRKRNSRRNYEDEEYEEEEEEERRRERNRKRSFRRDDEVEAKSDGNSERRRGPFPFMPVLPIAPLLHRNDDKKDKKDKKDSSPVHLNDNADESERHRHKLFQRKDDDEEDEEYYRYKPRRHLFHRHSEEEF